MKKTYGLLLIICFSFLFTSCKKEDNTQDSTGYYISAKVNGTQKNYTFQPLE